MMTFAILLLALVVGGGIGLTLVRVRRRQQDRYHAHYPVFSERPLRAIIDTRGRLRQFYLSRSPKGFLIGADLLEASAAAAITRQVNYRQSRCETIFATREDAERLLNEEILRTLHEAGGSKAAIERCLITADGARYRLTLTATKANEPTTSAAPGADLTPTTSSSLPAHIAPDAWIERGGRLHKQLMQELEAALKTLDLTPDTSDNAPAGESFVLRLTRESVMEGTTHTLQIQLSQVFQSAEAGKRALETLLATLRQRGPVFAQEPHRSLRTPNGLTQHFYISSQPEGCVVGLEQESGPADPIKQTLMPGLHPQRSAAEAEATSRFESYRLSDPLFSQPPTRMMLAPDGRHYRGHIGEVSQGFKAGIEFDSTTGRCPFTHQEVLDEVWPTTEAAEAALAAALDRAKANHPAFSTPPLRAIHLSDGTVIHLHVCPLPEDFSPPHLDNEPTVTRTAASFPGATNRAYLQYLQRVLLSQFEGYRQEHQSAQSRETARVDAYDPRFSIGIERNTVEGGLHLTVQTQMPDYSFSWSAQADLQGMAKRLLHNSALFCGLPVRSITTPDGLTRRLHIGAQSDAFIVGIESHQTQGSTALIRQVELSDVHLNRESAELYVKAHLEAYRQTKALFKSTPAREVTAPDGTQYRFYIAEMDGGFRIGMEHEDTPTSLKQSVLDTVFPDYDTAEIEAYRIRAKT